MESVTIIIVMGGSILLSTYERVALNKSGWGEGIAFVTGLLIVGTYSLVLAARTCASNFSYITAFCQLSFPLGTILGLLVQ